MESELTRYNRTLMRRSSSSLRSSGVGNLVPHPGTIGSRRALQQARMRRGQTESKQNTIKFEETDKNLTPGVCKCIRNWWTRQSTVPNWRWMGRKVAKPCGIFGMPGCMAAVPIRKASQWDWQVELRKKTDADPWNSIKWNGQGGLYISRARLHGSHTKLRSRLARLLGRIEETIGANTWTSIQLDWQGGWIVAHEKSRESADKKFMQVDSLEISISANNATMVLEVMCTHQGPR